MKTKLLAVALVASAALVAPVQGGDHHGQGGGGNFAGSGRGAARSGGGGGGPSFRSMPAGRFGGGQSFRSMPMRSFGANRMVDSGQRFSSGGLRSPRSMEFRSHPVNSNVGGSVSERQFTRGNINRIDRVQHFANDRNQSIANLSREGNGQFRNRGNQFQNGNGFARNNDAIRNQRNGAGQLRNGANAFRNGANQVRNGNNRLRSDWQNHVFSRRSAGWHRDWDRDHDHWWNGHRCHFFNGSWVIFDVGFYPWWPWWYSNDYYYGYGYGYPYNYGYYPYNYGSSYNYGYDDSGAYDDSAYGQNGYGDQSANSTVAAVQDRLAREGYYRGQIDGVLGPETRYAILRYQSNHGIRASGELTTEMLDALGLRQDGNYSSY